MDSMWLLHMLGCKQKRKNKKSGKTARCDLHSYLLP